MKDEILRSVFEVMDQGEVPDLWSVLSALNEIPDLVTLDRRPAEPSEPLTTCQLNGRQSCQD